MLSFGISAVPLGDAQPQINYSKRSKLVQELHDGNMF